VAAVGARTPDELETLFEDALIRNDRSALAALFAAGAVLAVDDEPPARGEDISRASFWLWGNGHSYIAEPSRVLVARDVALIVTERGVNVARRDGGGGWRYAIVRQTVAGDNGRYGKESESWP
jgi:hypothetical protein